LANADQLWTCRAVDIEVVYNAHACEVDDIAVHRRVLNNAPITSFVAERSLDVAVEMAAAGLHRHAKPMDLIIAAAAEAEDLAVLHYDRNFDHIASITGQPTEWVAPPGSLD
jgi:hypothetical protein